MNTQSGISEIGPQGKGYVTVYVYTLHDERLTLVKTSLIIPLFIPSIHTKLQDLPGHSK
jgi:hypothetical protein